MKILNNHGQTLIEAMVALGVLAVVIGAIAMTTITGMNNSNFSKNQNLATQYAQQGMDNLRQQSGSDWSTFDANSDGTYCLGLGSTTLTKPCAAVPNINGVFLRQVVINTPSPNCTAGKKVSVIVSWADGKCTAANRYCHNVTLDSCLAEINNL